MLCILLNKQCIPFKELRANRTEIFSVLSLLCCKKFIVIMPLRFIIYCFVHRCSNVYNAYMSANKICVSLIESSLGVSYER